MRSVGDFDIGRPALDVLIEEVTTKPSGSAYGGIC